MPLVQPPDLSTDPRATGAATFPAHRLPFQLVASGLVSLGAVGLLSPLSGWWGHLGDGELPHGAQLQRRRRTDLRCRKPRVPRLSAGHR